MALMLHQEADGKVLFVRVSDKLRKQDYEQFGPAVDKMIEDGGKIRILCQLTDFHGWDFSGLWEDVKFDIKHFSDIERVAIVGDKPWEKLMAFFCKPFTRASVRYYDSKELDAAREWIEAGLPVTTGTSSE